MLLVTILIGLLLGYTGSLIIQRYPMTSGLLELKSLYISNIKENRIDCFIPLVNTLLYVIVFYNTTNYLEQTYFSLISTILILIAYIDIKEMEIPDSFIIVGYLITVSYKTLNIILYKQSMEIFNSFISAIIAVAFFSILFFISRKQMGGGDIHLAGLIGFSLGTNLIMITIILAFFTFIVVAALYYKKYKDINREIPFAPFLIFAFYISLLYGEQILEICRKF